MQIDQFSESFGCSTEHATHAAEVAACHPGICCEKVAAIVTGSVIVDIPNQHRTNRQDTEIYAQYTSNKNQHETIRLPAGASLRFTYLSIILETWITSTP